MVPLVMCHSTPETPGNPSRTVTPTPSLEQVACLLYQGSHSEVTPMACFTEKKFHAGVECWLPKPLVSWVFPCRSLHYQVHFGSRSRAEGKTDRAGKLVPTRTRSVNSLELEAKERGGKTWSLYFLLSPDPHSRPRSPSLKSA